MTMRAKFRKRLAALVCVAALAQGTAARAGDELEHRHMIYALAITAGYSPAEAKVVSDASWSIDKNNATIATPEDIKASTGLFLARVALDKGYVEKLLTDNKALDADIFDGRGLLARVGPSAFEHSLMRDPRATADKVAPGLDLVYRKYSAEQVKKARDAGAGDADVRKLQLVLQGQYLHQMVDSYVHPHDAVLGHIAVWHGADYAVYHKKQFTAAAMAVMNTLHGTLGEIRPVTVDGYKALNLTTEKERQTFCEGLVGSIAKSYSGRVLSTGWVVDREDLTVKERIAATTNVANYVNDFLKERGSDLQVSVPRFDKVTFAPDGKGGMGLSYENTPLATVDNVVDWVLAKPEFADLVDSVRKNVREKIRQFMLDKVSGVRMDFDQQAIVKILTDSGGEENAKRLAALDEAVKAAKTPAAASAIVTEFVAQSRARFRAGQQTRPIKQLAAVSLKQLVTEAEKYAGKWAQLPADLRTPGHLTRIHGFVISGDDILIVGRQEKGAPEIEIDDLVVGIAAAWKRNETPLVSLDPDPANMEGDPRVRIQGVPGDSGFALTMLEADYAMKKIMAGKEAVDVPGYRTLKDALAGSKRTFMSRFWLYPIQPGIGDIVISPDRTSAVFDAGVQVLSEEMLQMKDGLVGTGATFGAAEEAAGSFSANYAAIAAKRPVFRKLEGLFDIVLLGRIWHVRNLESPLLDRLCALPHKAVTIAKTYPAIEVEVQRDGDTVYYIRGGAMAKMAAGRRNWLAVDDEGMATLRKKGAEVAGGTTVAASLSEVTLQASPPKLRKDTSSRDFSAAAQRLHRGDIAGAMDIADRMVKADPWDSEALVLRALIHLRKSDYERAAADAVRAGAIDPEDRDAAAAMGQILFQCAVMRGDPESALRHVEAVGDTKSAAGLIERGDALAMLDKPDDARKAFLKALERDPASALACAKLAEFELAQNRTPDAQPWIDKARALDPELPEVRIVQAMMYQAIIRPDLAEEIAKDLWAKKASGPVVRLKALTLLTMVAASREKWKDVDAYVGMMDELASGSPEVYCVAAEIAITWAEKGKAKAYLEKAEKLSPTHPRVLKLKARIAK